MTRERACPSCATPLVTGELGGAPVEVCAVCRGAWITAEAWRRVFGRSLDAVPSASSGGRSLACPACSDVELELRSVRGAEVIEIDACPGCGGAFLDAGEIQELRSRSPARRPSRPEPPAVEPTTPWRPAWTDTRVGVAVAAIGAWLLVATGTAAAPSWGLGVLGAIGLLGGIGLVALGRRAPGRAGADADAGEPAPAAPEVSAAQEPPTPNAEPERLTLTFACAQCGGPVEAEPGDRVLVCPWCGSWSRLLRARVADACAVDCADLTETDLAVSWIERQVATFRAERLAAMRRDEDLLARAIAEKEAEAAARRERDRLRRSVRVGQRRLIRVPYLHEHADGLQVVLGRDRDGMKRTAVVGFTAEETEPAYDTRRHDFRDRGLRLHRGRLRLLSADDVREGFEGLPVADPAGVARYRLNAQRVRPRRHRLSELCRAGELSGRRRQIVYKPYWLAEIREGDRVEWLLVDGQTGLAAGSVGTADELQRLLEPPGESPFLPDWEARAVLVPHRCPECGQDLEPDRQAWFLPCTNCHVGLVRGEAGLDRCSYSHVSVGGRRADWLPAWRFRFTSPRGLEELGALRRVLGDRTADGQPEQAFAWVPAIRLLGSLPGDRGFARFCDEAHHADWEVVDEALPPVTQGRILGATLSAEQAEPLARASVAASLRMTELARVNVALFREHVLAHGWRFEEPRLVLLPGRLEEGDRFRLHGARWHLPGRPRLV